ncbi:glycosyltransferase [bacterium]|nr:glycosyltransferase [bacterium]
MGSVLHVTNMYPTASAPYYGIFVREQFEALRARGIDVELFFIDGLASKLNYSKIFHELAFRLHKGGVSAIHSHHTFTTIIALLARKFARAETPIIESFHEGEVFNPRPNLAPRNWKWLKAFALRRADFVMPVEKRMLAAVLGDEARQIVSEVIPAGIDLKQFTPGDADEAREDMEWPEEGPILLFPFAPGKPAKRHDLVAAAHEIVRRKCHKARLIVGGTIRHEQMPDALRACDAVLLISDYEASPTIVKEALACERPVVATDVGDVREMFGDLAGVKIVEPTPESIARGVLEALDAPKPFGGRERIEKLGLDIERTADRIVECYKRIGAI